MRKANAVTTHISVMDFDFENIYDMIKASLKNYEKLFIVQSWSCFNLQQNLEYKSH